MRCHQGMGQHSGMPGKAPHERTPFTAQATAGGEASRVRPASRKPGRFYVTCSGTGGSEVPAPCPVRTSPAACLNPLIADVSRTHPTPRQNTDSKSKGKPLPSVLPSPAPPPPTRGFGALAYRRGVSVPAKGPDVRSAAGTHSLFLPHTEVSCFYCVSWFNSTSPWSQDRYHQVSYLTQESNGYGSVRNAVTLQRARASQRRLARRFEWANVVFLILEMDPRDSFTRISPAFPFTWSVLM